MLNHLIKLIFIIVLFAICPSALGTNWPQALDNAKQTLTALNGIADEEDLGPMKKFVDKLRTKKPKPESEDIPAIKYFDKDMSEIFLNDRAKDLKRLKAMHSLALKGSWTKLTEEASQLSDRKKYYTTETLLQNFKDNRDKPNFALNPKLWELLEKGQSELDNIIDLLKVEIDATETCIHKEFEALKKLNWDFPKAS